MKRDTLVSDDTNKQVSRKLTSGCDEKQAHFKPKRFDWNFCYHHIVEDHSNLCHVLPALDETWITTRWEICTFLFLLARTHANSYLIMRFSVWKQECENKGISLDFWQNLHQNNLQQPIDKWGRGWRREKRIVCNKHDHVQAPPHVTKFEKDKWNKNANKEYQYYICRTSGCNKECQ